MPLFVSRRTLGTSKKAWPRALGPWALDSGGFSELSMFGGWKTSAETYVAEVRRAVVEIGHLRWAAIQDWMCEPWILKKTGLSIDEHQRRTVDSLVELRTLAPELPWTPVLQGWRRDDYLRHVEMYEQGGVDLAREPLVGLGSVCRRHATREAEWIVDSLRRAGVDRLHGFGFKSEGLAKLWGQLASADSLAWSFRARRSPPLAGHPHKSCANCPEFALAWRERMLARCLVAPSQHVLGF